MFEERQLVHQNNTYGRLKHYEWNRSTSQHGNRPISVFTTKFTSCLTNILHLGGAYLQLVPLYHLNKITLKDAIKSLWLQSNKQTQTQSDEYQQTTQSENR